MTLSAIHPFQPIAVDSLFHPDFNEKALSLETLEDHHLRSLNNLKLADHQRGLVATPAQLTAQPARADGQHAHFVAVCWRGRAIGMFGYTLDTHGRAVLFGFQIDLAYQALGIGRWTLRNFLAHLERHAPVNHVALEITKTNLTAAAFFVSEGFCVTLPPAGFRRDAWHMEKTFTEASVPSL